MNISVENQKGSFSEKNVLYFRLSHVLYFHTRPIFSFINSEKCAMYNTRNKKINGASEQCRVYLEFCYHMCVSQHERLVLRIGF